MFVSGELNHFSYYFGKSRNLVYCSIKVDEKSPDNLIFQKPKYGKIDAEKLVGVKLVETPDTVALLLNRKCYFELEDEADKEKGNTYKVIKQYTKAEFEEKNERSREPLRKRVGFTGKKFDFSFMNSKIYN